MKTVGTQTAQTAVESQQQAENGKQEVLMLDFNDKILQKVAEAAEAMETARREKYKKMVQLEADNKRLQFQVAEIPELIKDAQQKKDDGYKIIIEKDKKRFNEEKDDLRKRITDLENDKKALFDTIADQAAMRKKEKAALQEEIEDLKKRLQLLQKQFDKEEAESQSRKRFIKVATSKKLKKLKLGKKKKSKNLSGSRKDKQSTSKRNLNDKSDENANENQNDNDRQYLDDDEDQDQDENDQDEEDDEDEDEDENQQQQQQDDNEEPTEEDDLLTDEEISINSAESVFVNGEDNLQKLNQQQQQQQQQKQHQTKDSQQLIKRKPRPTDHKLIIKERRKRHRESRKFLELIGQEKTNEDYYSSSDDGLSGTYDITKRRVDDYSTQNLYLDDDKSDPYLDQKNQKKMNKKYDYIDEMDVFYDITGQWYKSTPLPACVEYMYGQDRDEFQANLIGNKFSKQNEDYDGLDNNDNEYNNEYNNEQDKSAGIEIEIDGQVVDDDQILKQQQQQQSQENKQENEKKRVKQLKRRQTGPNSPVIIDKLQTLRTEKSIEDNIRSEQEQLQQQQKLDGRSKFDSLKHSFLTTHSSLSNVSETASPSILNRSNKKQQNKPVQKSFLVQHLQQIRDEREEELKKVLEISKENELEKDLFRFEVKNSLNADDKSKNNLNNEQQQQQEEEDEDDQYDDQKRNLKNKRTNQNQKDKPKTKRKGKSRDKQKRSKKQLQHVGLSQTIDSTMYQSQDGLSSQSDNGSQSYQYKHYLIQAETNEDSKEVMKWKDYSKYQNPYIFGHSNTKDKLAKMQQQNSTRVSG
ncbi:MAG: hypothetical protein EZS28_004925 [Streblomastix strix]|uniref:Uncharacterized protein n=1 Tax=Streblomastix strix TaxID=222440 RepID=A0A5J4WWW3_9EUKA|nr:MAG: hypothetical protein EZS28_004925 [Streblomastix strix]